MLVNLIHLKSSVQPDEVAARSVEEEVSGFQGGPRHSLDRYRERNARDQGTGETAMDLKKLPFDPLEYIEHLDELPFDPESGSGFG